MKLTLFKTLIGVFGLTVVLFIFVYLVPVLAVRVALGIPFLLFFPGFALLAAIAPHHEDMSTTERTILSLVLSIAVDSFIGLILHYAPAGITLESVLSAMVIFMVVFTVAGMVRIAALRAGEQAFIDFRIKPVRRPPATLNLALTALMAVVVIGAAASAVYFTLAPKTGEAFTQFYIVKYNGGALYNPAEPTTGDEASVVVGITNNEGRRVEYMVRAFVNGENFKETNPFSLDNGQQWEAEITVPVPSSGENQVEFRLFKNQETEPYLNSLRVWIGPSG